MSVDAFLHPRSVAVVGASGRPGNPFARPMQFFTDHDFDGEGYPVDPRYEQLYEVPCYLSLSAIPGPVDLAPLLIPPEAAAGVVAECGEVGVRAAIVLVIAHPPGGGVSAVDCLVRLAEPAEVRS